MNTHSSEHGSLPLAPIEKPTGLLARLFFWGARRRYGRVPIAMRVIYARAPFIGVASLFLLSLGGKCRRLTPSLRAVLHVQMSSTVGCTFCTDISLAEMIREGLGPERFDELHRFEQSDAFSEAEKAALAYAGAVAVSPRVPDAIYDRLHRHYDDRGITELVWWCAVEHYLGSMALPLRLGSDHLADTMRSRTREGRSATHAAA